VRNCRSRKRGKSTGDSLKTGRGGSQEQDWEAWDKGWFLGGGRRFGFGRGGGNHPVKGAIGGRREGEERKAGGEKWTQASRNGFTEEVELFPRRNRGEKRGPSHGFFSEKRVRPEVNALQGNI